MRYLFTALLALSLLVLAPGPADSSRGPKRATTAKKQQQRTPTKSTRSTTHSRRPRSRRRSQRHDYRNALGRFSPTPRGRTRGDQTILRRGLRGSGQGNSGGGLSRYDFTFQPATARGPGKLTVKMTEWYGGAMPLEARTTNRQVFVRDARGNTVGLDATMKIGRGKPSDGYRPLTLEVAIPAGVQITQRGLKDVLIGGPVFASRYQFDFSGAKAPARSASPTAK